MCEEKKESEVLLEAFQRELVGEKSIDPSHETDTLYGLCTFVNRHLGAAIEELVAINGRVSDRDLPTDCSPGDGTKLGNISAQICHIFYQAAYISQATEQLGNRLRGADDVRSQ